MSSRKIIIDAVNLEETRIAVLSNGELEEYDFEVSNKEEVKGNIYLAKVTRVESSLQAVFVEYSRNRQGFLPFNEISIDYFNLPEETKEKLKLEYSENRFKKKKNKEQNTAKKDDITNDSSIDWADSVPSSAQPHEGASSEAELTSSTPTSANNPNSKDYVEENINNFIQQSSSNGFFMNLTNSSASNKEESKAAENPPLTDDITVTPLNETEDSQDDSVGDADFKDNCVSQDAVSKEYIEYGTRFGYKIQDVISKNQLILVQVVKDERGSKGASLTTYLSIPGRYCVFMPNSCNQEGGISKKIVDVKERTRLKNVLNSLEIEGKGALIIRTAGVNKPDAEIKQDYSYIINLWDNIRTKAQQSDEPILIYEEASLIKKVLRDLQYDEVHVNNKNTYYNMLEFVKLISPETAKKIKLYQGKRETLFNYFNIEEQVKSIYSPIVFLKSGGYLVIHPTEALTAIDINSGKFKGNKNVEETALKNNLEAAKEIAKQIKLRNLGGLIVIDFIDMENPKNKFAVEKKLREEVKYDKAKIQVGQISNFGLLEMARQHVKSSLFEKNFIICPKCQGMGYSKPLELNALQILRDIKHTILKMNIPSGQQLKIKMPTDEAFFILNNKRYALNNLEECFDINLTLECDDSLPYPFYEIKKVANNVNKTRNQTVLLLETEIANNMKIFKSNLTKKSHSKHNSTRNKDYNNNRNKSYNLNGNYKKHSHNNSSSKPPRVQKRNWLQRLFKM